MNSRPVHPWLFMVLVTPFGVVSGYIGVTLAYQLRQVGVPVAAVAAMVALSVLPNTWKFFWAPVIDLTLTQKKWHVLAGVITAAGIAGMGFFPATKAGLAALSSVCFLASLAATFQGMAVDSLMAYSTPEELKGRAGGWSQAGNLGGNGIGGGLGLYLAQHLPAPWIASSIVGFLCILCSLALAGVPSPVRSTEIFHLRQRVTETAKDVWDLVRRRAGILALILCFLPVGSGAAPLSAIADEWKASADMVALITGVLGGLISAAGCLVGGWFCDRMNRQAAYVWFGVLQAAGAVAMALSARSSANYEIWASVYNFTSGLTYAAFTAFVLEAIGRGAAATKYNAMASLSNVPIWYMTKLDGWTHDKWDSAIMFYGEAALGIVGAMVFFTLANTILRPARQDLEAR